MRMSKKDTGGNAFPAISMSGSSGEYFPVTESGMSLRDWFAGMAMQGLNAAEWTQDMKANTIASVAYDCADAMIAEREKS